MASKAQLALRIRARKHAGKVASSELLHPKPRTLELHTEALVLEFPDIKKRTIARRFKRACIKRHYREERKNMKTSPDKPYEGYPDLPPPTELPDRGGIIPPIQKPKSGKYVAIIIGVILTIIAAIAALIGNIRMTP